MQALPIERICTNGGTQARVQLDWVAVSEYSAAMQAGDVFPPVIVFHDGTTYWLADGFHRVDAARRAGLESLPADVRMGTQRDAVLFAVGANSSHGVRRTNADKRAAVLKLLADDDWQKWTDVEIGRRAGVSSNFVGDMRRIIHPINDTQPVTRTVSRNGSTYQMNTAAIGKPQPLPSRFVPAIAPDPIPFEDEPEAYDETPEPEPEPEAPASNAMGRLAVHFTSNTPEHYTPQDVLDRAIACMGGIDLDPCSNSHETPNVPAATHYTAQDDGLAQDWQGTVFMNPPYGREIDAWVRKLVDGYENGNVTEAIALVPARTDTQWWQLFNNYHVCLVVGRLTFIGNNDPAPFPSAIVYLGGNTDAFVNSFEDLGPIWHRTRHGYCFGE